RDAQQTLDALRDKKSRSEVAPNPDRPPPIATAPLVVDARRDAPPPSVPRFGGEQRRPTASSGEQPPPAPPSQRQASAAEILLARRRGKRLSRSRKQRVRDRAPDRVGVQRDRGHVARGKPAQLGAAPVLGDRSGVARRHDQVALRAHDDRARGILRYRQL